MYPDIIYDLINTSIRTWPAFAAAYALFDYGFNTVMCIITGGIHAIRSYQKKTWKRSIFRVFYNGGRERLREFQLDFLSWFWPLTNLAIPIALYGYTRQSIISTFDSLVSINIQASNYWLLPSTPYIQIILWCSALSSGIFTIIRYKYHRSKLTWFSKSTLFSTMRAILFDTPIGFAILNIILLTLNFLVSLYRILLDNNIQYMIFHPDQLYGLKTAYDTVIFISLVLIIISFLPTSILLREKQQTYTTIYKLGIYTGIIVTFVLMSILIYQFNQRLEYIHQQALLSDWLVPLYTKGDNLQVLTGLNYYYIVANLPAKFPVPTWLNSLFSIRAVVLVYEIYRGVVSNPAQASLSEILKTIVSKL